MDDRWIEKENKKILQEIIKKIEQGTPPWRKPWARYGDHIVVGARKCDVSVWPRNLQTPLVPFGPANGVYLLTVANLYGFRTNFWINQKTVKDLGLKNPDRGPWSIQKGYSHEHAVYNVGQFDQKSLGFCYLAENFSPQFKKSERLLQTLKDKPIHRLKIMEGGNKAAYNPARDFIRMPSVNQFKAVAKSDLQGEAHYWATMWHEIVHWTGHPTRLKRPMSAAFGDQKYAYEELIAELGAAFLCSHLQIRADIQSASYLRSWINSAANSSPSGDRTKFLQGWATWLKSEGLHALVKAGGQANQAAQFVLNGGKMPTSKKKTPPSDDIGD